MPATTRLSEFGWRNNLRLGWSETSQPYTSLGLAANLSFLIRVQDGAVDLDLFTTGSTGYKIQLVWCIRLPALLGCPDDRYEERGDALQGATL